MLDAWPSHAVLKPAFSGIALLPDHSAITNNNFCIFQPYSPGPLRILEEGFLTTYTRNFAPQGALTFTLFLTLLCSFFLVKQITTAFGLYHNGVHHSSAHSLSDLSNMSTFCNRHFILFSFIFLGPSLTHSSLLPGIIRTREQRFVLKTVKSTSRVHSTSHNIYIASKWDKKAGRGSAASYVVLAHTCTSTSTNWQGTYTTNTLGFHSNCANQWNHDMWTGGSAIYAQYFCAVVLTNWYQVCCVSGSGAIVEHLYIKLM